MSELSEIDEASQGQTLAEAEGLDSFRDRITESLQLEKYLPKAQPETRSRICGLISQTMFDLQPLTDVPLRNLSAAVKEGGKARPIYTPNRDANGGTISYGEAMIRFFAKWVEAPVHEVIKRPVAIELRLTADDQMRIHTAHEMFHVREAKGYPRRWNRTAPTDLDEEKDGYVWGEDRAELAAELFALQYIKERKTTGVADSMSKFLQVWDAGRRIRKIKKLRLKKGY
jgi:hypothetical protein